ncbi:Peptidyl-prolyl cis-trans isomerase [Sphingomonas antarctica]|uniref:FKBP-type peptidyl-prolyl cis-trans isomerase n=1 Tax=Sphingomonas antarctica TaxID=2040274 RepID=UPI0039E8AD44
MSEVTAVPLRPIKKGAVTRLWLGIAVAVLGAGAVAWAGTSKSVAISGTNEQFFAWHAGQPGVKTTPSGLQYQILKAGKGPSPTDTDIALVNYKGALRDGTVFDESKQPTPFPVTQVVPGFSEGLKLMPKGSKFRLWIPSALGYGERSPDPKLPANSVLVFDVEMIDFRSQAEVQQQMMQQQIQQQMQGGGQPGGQPQQ